MQWQWEITKGKRGATKDTVLTLLYSTKCSNYLPKNFEGEYKKQKVRNKDTQS